MGRAWPVALAAFFTPLPVVVYNPDFVRTPAQWLELLALSVATLGGVAAACWLVARALGRSLEGAVGAAAWAWLVAALALVGWIVASPPLAAGVSILCAVVAAITTLRHVRPGLAVPITAAAAAVVLSALAYVAVRPRAIERQVVLIGLDGTTWPLVNEFRARGDLPNFARLIDNGSSGELDTLDPILSPPIWTSIASGRIPDVHGVRDFWASAHDVKAKRLWDVTDAAGLVTGVYGYLVTWPPAPISGFLIPGWTAKGAETWPAELSFIKRLERSEKSGTQRSTAESLAIAMQALRNGLSLATINEMAAALLARRTGERDEERIAAENRRLKLAFNTDMYCHLLRTVQPEFSIFYDSALDATEHLFFKYFEPAGFPSLPRERVELLADAIPTIYRRADATLGRILENVSPGANVVVVSDHGQRVDDKGDSTWYTVQSERLLDELRLGDTLRATNVGEYVYLRAIDEDRADPAELARAWDALGDLVMPDGKPLLELRIGTRTEGRILVAEEFDLASMPEVEFRGRRIRAADILEKSGTISGVHTPTAFFAMMGPDVRPGLRLSRGSILDIAPTVLALLELPVARDMEGEVLSDGFTPAFLSSRELAWVESYGAPERPDAPDAAVSDDKLVESLRALGYLR